VSKGFSNFGKRQPGCRTPVWMGNSISRRVRVAGAARDALLRFFPWNEWFASPLDFGRGVDHRYVVPICSRSANIRGQPSSWVKWRHVSSSIGESSEKRVVTRQENFGEGKEDGTRCPSCAYSIKHVISVPTVDQRRLAA
jgi:hypothetical protein